MNNRRLQASGMQMVKAEAAEGGGETGAVSEAGMGVEGDLEGEGEVEVVVKKEGTMVLCHRVASSLQSKVEDA